jgi:hypothetical protein
MVAELSGRQPSIRSSGVARAAVALAESLGQYTARFGDDVFGSFGWAFLDGAVLFALAAPLLVPVERSNTG